MNQVYASPKASVLPFPLPRIFFQVQKVYRTLSLSFFIFNEKVEQFLLRAQDGQAARDSFKISPRGGGGGDGLDLVGQLGY